MISQPLRSALVFCAALLLVVLSSRSAQAYPWMIRHGYTGCTPCHTDPSGGAGVLTEYGRAQSDLLLRMRYGESTDSGEAGSTAGFMWGLIPLPEGVRLTGGFREAYLDSQAQGAPTLTQWITMQADLTGDIKVGRFRAAGNIGYAPEGDLFAAITNHPTDNVITREHWVGAELDEDGAWLLRGGRIAVPFGIRNIEHTLFARTLTRTDIDDTQQYGLSLYFAHEKLRGELMAIAGNFQISPDEFRERGYSTYVEYAPVTTLAVGASSLFTRATRDIYLGVTDYRYCNGVFARYSPAKPLVILAEMDSVYQSLTWNGHRGGFAGYVQADVEAVQGLHLMGTAETMNGGSAGEPISWDVWGSAAWFFLPHADLRIDGIFSTLGSPPTAVAPASQTSVTTWLLQVHAFL